MKKSNDLRSQLKATSIKSLRKKVEEDDKMIGVERSNEYLNLEDGKTIKIRIFPGHPGMDGFCISKKCYWLTFVNSDGETYRGQVLDSRMHGGTKMDIVEEYVKFAKKLIGGDENKLDALIGTGPKSNSLNPSYTWLCYADKVNGDDPLKAKLWEFKKMMRDAINRLAFSEDEDDVIEVDPFTDPDEGLPILVTYRKNPNKKKGENYYEASFPKKANPRPLTDDEIEAFMAVKPLNEILQKYGMKDFERALEGLQYFDEENEIGAFDEEEWLERVEEIKAQYDAAEEEDEDEDKSTKKKRNSSSAKKKQTSKKKVEEPEEEEDEDEETDEPEEDDEQEEDDDDEFTDMSRQELKKYITKNSLDITVKKSMSDDDLRNAIREAEKQAETEEDEAEDEEEETDDDQDEEDEKPAMKSRVTLDDIRKKLQGKK